MKKLPTILQAAAALFVALSAGCKPKQPQAGAGAFRPAVQVVAIEAKRQPVTETLSLVGNIVANEMVEIKAETEGTVEQINFNEGQRVEKGTLLLKLDESKPAASLAQSEANHMLAHANFERAKQLHRDKLISQQDFDQASASFSASEATILLMRRQLKDARIYAPFAGMTGSRQISPGQVISRNQTLTWLVDLDIVKVEVRIPEKYLSQVRLGMPLTFKVAAFPGQSFHGEVYFISPQLDESTRTALVKARIENSGAMLKAGMFASLDLTLRLKEDALIIPEPALLRSGEAVMVFAIDSNTNAVMRDVKVGLRLAGKVEILSGVTAGERVVVEGTQKLYPGAAVKLSPPAAEAPYQN